MFSVKKFVSAVAVTLLLLLPISVSAATVADWEFNPKGVKSGSINSGNMIISDKTGNGNDLTMRHFGLNYKKTVEFTEESIDGESGSMFFHGNLLLGGIDFVTVDNAPINKNNFANGYTIEIIYKMPDDWSQTDRWQNILARLSPSFAGVEEPNVSVAYNISNCKEIQIQTRDKDLDSADTAWSIAMDKAENWYHIVIVGDNSGIRSYINGCESFRNTNVTNMQGLYADPSDGRFRIGSTFSGGSSPYKYLRGYIQQIRIENACRLLESSDKHIGDIANAVGYEDIKFFCEIFKKHLGISPRRFRTLVS
jgi:hypothetical protein